MKIELEFDGVVKLLEAKTHDEMHRLMDAAVAEYGMEDNPEEVNMRVTEW